MENFYPDEEMMRAKSNWEIFIKTPEGKIIRLQKTNPADQINKIKERYL